MRLEADRIAALIVVTLGLVLLFVIFPIAIEDIDDGSIRPDVVPNTLAGFLVFCGILLATKPGKQIQRSSRELKMVLIYLAVIALGLFAIFHFGFVVASAFLALTIMMLFGERRLGWLALGCLGMPAAIWFLVAHVLERPLP